MIEKWLQYGNKRRGAVYRLTDFFSLFYFKFLADNLSHDDEWWSNHLDSEMYSTGWAAVSSLSA